MGCLLGPIAQILHDGLTENSVGWGHLIRPEIGIDHPKILCGLDGSLSQIAHSGTRPLQLRLGRN
jgi:hypothetical protein